MLDTLGCAFGALDGEPIRAYTSVRSRTSAAPNAAPSSAAVETAPDRAAFYNSALVRYLDYNDSFLAKGETCHPSDNLAPVLARVEYAGASGREFLTALAVAYQVQCRLEEERP